jgi:hypothetical protein
VAEEKKENVFDQQRDDLLSSDLYQNYKTTFKDVMEQMSTRRYLIKGYVTYVTKAPMVGPVTIRTLTKRESDFCEIQAAGAVTEIERNTLRSKMVLALIIESIDGQELHISAPDKDTDFNKWMKRPEVDAKFKATDNLAEFDADIISTRFGEVILDRNGSVFLPDIYTRHTSMKNARKWQEWVDTMLRRLNVNKEYYKDCDLIYIDTKKYLKQYSNPSNEDETINVICESFGL